MCRRFGTLCLFLLLTYTAYEDGTECSETSAREIQTPRNHPKERIQRSEPRRKFEIKIALPSFLTSVKKECIL